MAKYISVTRANGDLEYIKLADTKEYGYSYFPVLCSDGVTRYAMLGESSDANASSLWIKQNGVKKYVIRQPHVTPVTPSVYLTMGGYSDRYGFYDPYVSFVIQVDGETSGTYNANVTLIDSDTNKKGSIYFSNMYYQYYSKAFVGDQTLYSGDLYDFFSDSNVGKKYIIKVDIAKQ